MKFRDQLKNMGACEESIKWVGNKTIEEAWETCENSQWMIWVLSKTNLDLIDPICDIAERVLHLVPEEHKLVCSNAINAAQRRASKDELDAAYYAAWGAAYIARNTTSDAIGYHCHLSARHDYWAICAAASAAADAASAAYAANAAVNVASSAAYAGDATATAAGYIKEQKKQCDIFRKYFTIDQVKEAFNKLVGIKENNLSV